MNNLVIVGILATSSLSTVSLSAQTHKSPTTQSAVDRVRNGYLKYNQTITIGQALERTFSNGTWKFFVTPKGATLVEFNGTAPYGDLNNGIRDCNSNQACNDLSKRINDFCNSAAGQDQATKDYLERKTNYGRKSQT